MKQELSLPCTGITICGCRLSCALLRELMRQVLAQSQACWHVQHFITETAALSWEPAAGSSS